MEVTHSDSSSFKDKLQENDSANDANGIKNKHMPCYDNQGKRKDSMCAKIRSDRVGMDANAEVCCEDDFQQHAGKSEKCGIHVGSSQKRQSMRKGHCTDVECQEKLRWKRVDKHGHARKCHGGDASFFLACEDPC